MAGGGGSGYWPTVASSRSQSVQNGSGTKVWYWLPGMAVKRKEFPMLLTEVSHNGITTPVLDRTHLSSEPPDEASEFGGREKAPGILSDPGQLVLTGFMNASIIFPKGIVVFQIVFPLPFGHVAPAKWTAAGFISNRGSISIMVDTDMTQVNTVELTGNVAITQARRRV